MSVRDEASNKSEVRYTLKVQYEFANFYLVNQTLHFMVVLKAKATKYSVIAMNECVPVLSLDR
jgi:hypothetical protein